MKKIWQTIIKIWKDSVWSKVIASAIIFLIATIWAKYIDYSLLEVYTFLIAVLAFKLPIYVFASIIGIVFLIKTLIKIFRRKKDPIWDEQVGNYTFKELYSILQSQNYPVRTEGMIFSGTKAPEDDLLVLFRLYSPYLNKGISLEDNINDGGYLYGVLAPIFVGYGIVEKLETRNEHLNVMDTKYQISQFGQKFFALLEKVIHLGVKK